MEKCLLVSHFLFWERFVREHQAGRIKWGENSSGKNIQSVKEAENAALLLLFLYNVVFFNVRLISFSWFMTKVTIIHCLQLINSVFVHILSSSNNWCPQKQVNQQWSLNEDFDSGYYAADLFSTTTIQWAFALADSSSKVQVTANFQVFKSLWE